MATICADEPRGYLVVFGDRLQLDALVKDRAHAEGYAAQSHGLCLRLYLSDEDEARLMALRVGEPVDGEGGRR